MSTAAYSDRPEPNARNTLAHPPDVVPCAWMVGHGLPLCHRRHALRQLHRAYFFLRGSVDAFAAEGGRYVPLTRPLIMPALLLASSGTAWWGEKGIERGDSVRLRIGLTLTLLLGLGFLGLQASEYAHRETSWTTSAYDSLFITITGFHGAHVAGGLRMNLYVQIRAWLGHFDAGRHQAVSNAVLYWHFVDGVWLFILASLYLSPRLF